MGLDMYLKKTVSGYRKSDGSLSHSFDDYTKGAFGESNMVDITTSVGYWRKANAIHRWFVENIQDGKDNCDEYGVEVEQLKELLDACMKIIKAVDGETITVDLQKEPNFDECEWLKDCPKSFVFDASNLEAMEEKLYYVHRLPETFAAVASDTLPTKAGFFFGSTDYDADYLGDIIKTARMLSKILADYDKLTEKEKMYTEFSYIASW